MSLPKSLPKTAVSLECAPFPPPSLPHPSSLSPSCFSPLSPHLPLQLFFLPILLRHTAML